MNEHYYFYIFILFVIGICIRSYLSNEELYLKCVISDVDGNKYCVRERNKIDEVADLLANVTIKLKKLVNHVKEKYPERENVKRLVNGFNPKKIYETLPTSIHTAYSENKGEKLAFCVTKNKNGTTLIDENTLTFVAIHEVAHIATKSIGHEKEFWANFKFLLVEAKEINIYNPQDYKKNPQKYCGMDITDNPYFDFND